MLTDGTQQNQGLDLSGFVSAAGQLLGGLLGSQSAHQQALERQRIQLEASLRRKVEDEFASVKWLLGALGILILLAVLVRR
ncbi:MAG: hypothetical protein RML48_04870 [Candidatus Bipolaricaulota bacterium]|nr:hypothetical protein [Candidatus Bipolaricaulota bacterium]